MKHNECSASSEYDRRRLLINRFVWRLIFGVVTIVVIMAVAYIITDTPIITNQMAMSQFENSNDWFVAMTVYQKFANAVETIRTVLTSIIVGLLIWSGIDLSKSLNT